MIDLTRRTVTIGGQEVRPSYRQFELIATLARYPGVPYTRDQLMTALKLSERVADVAISDYVKRVRALYARHGAANPIRTYHGCGYYWQG